MDALFNGKLEDPTISVSKLKEIINMVPLKKILLRGGLMLLKAQNYVWKNSLKRVIRNI